MSAPAFTPRQVRQFVLMAADKIERFPGKFNFGAIWVPSDGDGCGCALGWTGYFARRNGECVEDTSRALFGVDSTAFYRRISALQQDDDCWLIRASDCAKCLRRYADTYLPAPSAAEDDPVDLPASLVPALPTMAAQS